jgi:hypothetical protein
MSAGEWTALLIGFLCLWALAAYAQRDAKRQPRPRCHGCYCEVSRPGLCADCQIEVARGY